MSKAMAKEYHRIDDRGLKPVERQKTATGLKKTGACWLRPGIPAPERRRQE